MSKPTGPGSKALRIGRCSENGGAYFVTLQTDQRIPWFQEFDLACLMSRILHTKVENRNCKILCWVVMPDHVHFLVQLAEMRLCDAVRSIKGGSALKLNRQIGRRGRFWQPGYHDHGLRKEKSIVEVARYIVANPLRARIVKKIGNYPYWNAVWL